MSEREVERLDERAAAALAEFRARTPSKMAKRAKRIAFLVGAATVGGAVVAHVGWITPAWERPLIDLTFAMGLSWIAIDQYYHTKGNIAAGRGRWTSIAVGAFIAFEFVLRGSRGSDALFNIALGVVPLLFAAALFVDQWNRPRAHADAPRRMAGVTIFGLGAIATGLLASVFHDIPDVTWQKIFFGSIALLGVGSAMMYLDRRKREKAPLWERPAKQ